MNKKKDNDSNVWGCILTILEIAIVTILNKIKR